MVSQRLLMLAAITTLLAATVPFVLAQTASEETLPPVRHPQVGVCTHLRIWPVEKVIPLIADSGAKWIREDFFWDRIEATKGTYRMPVHYADWIERLHKEGLGIIAIINTGHEGNKLYEDPFDKAAFARFAAWFARETRGKVEAIEILNEPNNSNFMKRYGGVWNGNEKDGSVSPWIREYVDLVNVTARAIREANPDVKIIGAGGGPMPANFRGVALGIAPEVDGLTSHPYSPKTVPEIVPYAATLEILGRDGIATTDARGSFAEQMRAYRKHSRACSGPKEIWLTEWGYPTYVETKPGRSFFLGYTQRAQAKYILRRLVESLGVGIDVTVVYSFKDDHDRPNDAEANFGLVDYHLDPKLSYHAFRRCVRALAPYRSVEANPVDSRPLPSIRAEVFAIANRSDRHPVTWDGAKLESDGRIVTWTFADKTGNALLALWSTERADGDLTPVVADVEISSARPLTRIEAYSPFEDKRYELKFTKNGTRHLIEKIQIPDSPLFLTFH